METIAIIGLGTMGSAIQRLLPDKFRVLGIGRQPEQLAQACKTDVIIIAVKPQQFAVLAQKLRPLIKNQLIISIMAGVAIPTLTDALGTERIVRTMPNLALAKGQSLTAWHGVTTGTLQTILDLWGSSLQLDNEERFDAFTALAGSGPAYFFELARALEQAAVDQGFSTQQAHQISLQTFRGAASITAEDTSFAELVGRVASKGGTTEAALKVLNRQNFAQIISIAIQAACKRSQEIATQNDTRPAILKP